MEWKCRNLAHLRLHQFQLNGAKITTVIAHILLLVVFTFHGIALASSPTVKQSNSGICHSVESKWYERTKNYTPFDSINACLAAGGRLPKGTAQNRTTISEPSVTRVCWRFRIRHWIKKANSFYWWCRNLNITSLPCPDSCSVMSTGRS